MQTLPSYAKCEWHSDCCLAFWAGPSVFGLFLSLGCSQEGGAWALPAACPSMAAPQCPHPGRGSAASILHSPSSPEGAPFMDDLIPLIKVGRFLCCDTKMSHFISLFLTCGQSLQILSKIYVEVISFQFVQTLKPTILLLKYLANK